MVLQRWINNQLLFTTEIIDYDIYVCWFILIESVTKPRSWCGWIEVCIHNNTPGSQLGGCFTNVSRALQGILSKFVYCRNRTSYENFKLKLCTRAQSPALGTRTKFQLEILTINVISGMVYFREIFLESSRNVSETTPWLSYHMYATNSPGQNSRHFTDDIFKCIFMNESVLYFELDFTEVCYQGSN